MKYLFAEWEKIKGSLFNKFIFLFLDYDGTLTPIRKSFSLAVLSVQNKDLLNRLLKEAGCNVAIISGRSLKDIKKTVGINGLIYAGNHGLEIEGPGIKFESQISQRSKTAIRNISKDLMKRLSGIQGAIVEDKGLTISVHYRRVPGKNIPEFLSIFNEIISPYIFSGKIKLDSGKKVYEIKPYSPWNKGQVVLWLVRRQQFASGEKKVLPIYIGDDVTDEDAFKVLKGKGLTISVGKPGSSNADYYLKDTKEVARFLKNFPFED